MIDIFIVFFMQLQDDRYQVLYYSVHCVTITLIYFYPKSKYFATFFAEKPYFLLAC